MAPKSIPVKSQSHPPHGAGNDPQQPDSTPFIDSEEAQLSSPEGVQSDVSSVAIDGRFLAMGSRSAQVANGAVSGDGLSDAEVMLRVRAGDQAAFDYLVQKYRRPMVSFMYRMARNAAVAE